ncbi:MAG: hypothetical protein U0Q19_02955 [Kineosporiaceae bacterium]
MGFGSGFDGHSGGRSLLRAMGAGAPCVAYDVRFNRDVLCTTGAYFADARS